MSSITDIKTGDPVILTRYQGPFYDRTKNMVSVELVIVERDTKTRALVQGQWFHKDGGSQYPKPDDYAKDYAAIKSLDDYGLASQIGWAIGDRKIRVTEDLARQWVELKNQEIQSKKEDR